MNEDVKCAVSGGSSEDSTERGNDPLCKMQGCVLRSAEALGRGSYHITSRLGAARLPGDFFLRGNSIDYADYVGALRCLGKYYGVNEKVSESITSVLVGLWDVGVVLVLCTTRVLRPNIKSGRRHTKDCI